MKIRVIWLATYGEVVRRSRLDNGVPWKTVMVRMNERFVEIEHEGLPLD